jgi:hypothetical protein
MSETAIIWAAATLGTIVIFLITEMIQRKRRRDASARFEPRSPVSDLRRLGFFADRANLSDAELEVGLKKDLLEYWGDPIESQARTQQQADAYLVLHDPRLVYLAPDKYFYPGDETFLEIIAKVAELDGGRPDLLALAEEWESEQGPVVIRYSVAGKPREYRIEAPKYFDPGLIREIDQALDDPDRGLYVTDALGLPNLILSLPRATAEHLRRQRGWEFFA